MTIPKIGGKKPFLSTIQDRPCHASFSTIALNSHRYFTMSEITKSFSQCLEHFLVFNVCAIYKVAPSTSETLLTKKMCVHEFGE